ncbi:MAG: HlyC/CorC family transporter [Ruminococcaceae bacterium]|nr:HlyC/CorC family transporter [Oscillospiraceae bacterium]
MDSWGPILWLVVLVFLSAFFSGSEMSFASLSKSKLKIMAQDGKKGARTALSLADKFDTLLSTLLVGNNIVNIAASSIATALFLEISPVYGSVLSTAVMTVVILIFGEITPKTLAKDSPEKTALRAAPVLKILNIIFFPINFIFSMWKKLINKVFKTESDQSITEEELITIIDEAEEGGSLDEQESELIRSAIEFNDVDVEDILTPRVDIVAIPEDAPIDEIAGIFRSQRFSRIPVYRDSIDNVIGVLHEKDFNNMVYEKKSDISEIFHNVVFVPEKMKTSKLLRTFQKSKVHMAIVVDEFGGTAGIVTLEDVLEGLVGEIWDEHDEVIEECRKAGDNIYMISCGANFDTVSETLGFTDDENESATVGGWVQKELGKIPEVGDSFTYENLAVEVTKTENRRAIEIKVTITPDEDEENKGSDD